MSQKYQIKNVYFYDHKIGESLGLTHNAPTELTGDELVALTTRCAVHR